MAHIRQPIRPIILFFILKFRVSPAFYVRSTRYLSSHEDGNTYAHVEDSRNRWVSFLRQQQNRQRRQRRKHQESIVRAAGAESLFSLTLWPFFSKPSFRRIRNGESSFVGLPELEDLPPIDCEWACHSDEEKIQLQQMKFLLDSEMKALVQSKLHQLYPDVYSDLRLLRFLRKSKKRDIVSSSERYRSFLKWREENNVDEIRAMVGNNPSFMPPLDNLQRVAKYFPMSFDYVNRSTIDPDDENMRQNNTSRPAILYVGSFETSGISAKIRATETNISLDDFLDYWIYLYESIHFCLYQQSIRFGEMMFLDEVCDLSGLSLQQFSPYFVNKVMKPWLRMTQSNYPETTRRIFILKPPAILNLAWNFVTPLLSQGTVDKIRFEKKFKGTANEFCDNLS